MSSASVLLSMSSSLLDSMRASFGGGAGAGTFFAERVMSAILVSYRHYRDKFKRMERGCSISINIMNILQW